MRPVLCMLAAAVASASVLTSLENELFPQAQEVGLTGTHHVANCAVTAWSAWGDCTKSCGTGVQAKHRASATATQPAGCLMPSFTEELRTSETGCKF